MSQSHSAPSQSSTVICLYQERTRQPSNSRPDCIRDEMDSKSLQRRFVCESWICRCWILTPDLHTCLRRLRLVATFPSLRLVESWQMRTMCPVWYTFLSKKAPGSEGSNPVILNRIKRKKQACKQWFLSLPPGASTQTLTFLIMFFGFPSSQ